MLLFVQDFQQNFSFWDWAVCTDKHDANRAFLQIPHLWHGTGLAKYATFKAQVNIITHELNTACRMP